MMIEVESLQAVFDGELMCADAAGVRGHTSLETLSISDSGDVCLCVLFEGAPIATDVAIGSDIRLISVDELRRLVSDLPI